jgi:tripartite-type tricarboxylate transporter receptor subunit TctC
VKVIVPYAAGAAADVIGRIVAQKLSEHTGTQFYVENLSGAGSVTGTVVAARAPADGHTILLERIPLTFEHSPRGERSFCILVG